MIIHQMKLNYQPFNDIKNGIKTLELRLYDEKRRTVEIGNRIIFSNNGESITSVVIGLSRFRTFFDLFSSLGGISAGWPATATLNKMVEDMRQYYSEEEEQKYGVLGLHIKLT